MVYKIKHRTEEMNFISPEIPDRDSSTTFIELVDYTIAYEIEIFDSWSRRKIMIVRYRG